MHRWLCIAFIQVAGIAVPAARYDTQADDAKELTTVSVPEYGVKVQTPARWKMVVKAEETLAFGLTVSQDDPSQTAAVKCEIGPAPETLDEFRTRVDRRASRERVPGLTLASNEVLEAETGSRLVTLWNYKPAERPGVHDLEVRVIAHEQLYTFTLRAPDPAFDTVRPQFDKVVASAEFSAPDTGLELTKSGFCVQKKFRFGLKLPDGWRPSFPLSAESLFWAQSKPKGIWNDNLLVIATKARPMDLDAMAERIPEQLRKEDPNCTVKSCGKVVQGTIGDALETIVETQRGSFRITVLERRYPGRRYNYEIKFTVTSETFEKSADELRRSADSFIEFVAPQDLGGGAT